MDTSLHTPIFLLFLTRWRGDYTLALLLKTSHQNKESQLLWLWNKTSPTVLYSSEVPCPSWTHLPREQSTLWAGGVLLLPSLAQLVLDSSSLLQDFLELHSLWWWISPLVTVLITLFWDFHLPLFPCLPTLDQKYYPGKLLASSSLSSC